MKIRIIHIMNKNEDSERLAIVETGDTDSAEDFCVRGETVESDTIFECEGNITMFPIGYEWTRKS